MSHIGIVAVSTPRLGGTYPYTLSMIEALRLLPENRYTLFTAPDNDAYDGLGLPIVRIPLGLHALRQAVGRIFGRVDANHPFSRVDKLVAPIYTTYLLTSRTPFAFTLHDLQEKHYPEYFNLSRRVWRHVSNAGLTRGATRIICESNYVKSDIQRYFGTPAEKICVIPAPPVSMFQNVQLSAATLESVRQRVQVPQQYVLYPAQFFPHKNHLRLLDAFARVTRDFPDCHLVLTGQKQHEFYKVMAHVAQLGLSAKVLHVGYLDAQDLAAIYKMASLVVVPTLFESISIPIYEAFTLGVPVCASNVVALPEQVGDAGLLFDPFSVEDMSLKMAAVLGSADLRRDLVERGKIRVSSLTMHRYAQQLGVLLEQVGA